MNTKEIIGDISKGKILPVYILHGEESYYIDKVSDWIEKNLLEESLKSFNQIVMYGKDIDVRRITDEARQYPMMSDRRLVMVKEAQDIKDIANLASYLKNPVPHTVLVICHKHKKIDKRTAFGKMIDSLPGAYESKKLYDNQLPVWISEYSKEIGLTIGPAQSQIMAEYLGNDLNKIANELDKLALSTEKGKAVSTEEIQEQIGISKEFNVFDLQEVLAKKDKVNVAIMTRYFVANPKSAPIQMVVSSLFSFFTKILITSQKSMTNDRDLAPIIGVIPFYMKTYRIGTSSYSQDKLKEIIVKLAEIDLKSKGVMNRSGDDGPLFLDLMHFIMKG